MSIFLSVTAAENENMACALCTIIKSDGAVPRHTGSKMLVYADAKVEGSIGGGEAEILTIREAINCMKSGQSKIVSYCYNDKKKDAIGVCGGSLEIFIEPILGNPALLVIGIGHVGKQVALLGEKLGFNVIVSDDRDMNWNDFNFSKKVRILVCKMQNIADKIKITKNHYIVVTTRGNDIDIEGLPALLDHEWAYLGVIGSKHRWQLTKTELINAGESIEVLDKIHSPIGLDIHAETPEEIAVSILAEIISFKNRNQNKKNQ